ncbi:hypothetical protein NLG97_g3137 [Lecanicillium saksenae]|uniref:Uncharacterized protein n=1 Tax=Lecanicillium saksenae TaxID=468837 RepID=A0ACC1R0N8_9HYPO|nr:hypothetical protein NLG97_g3137 [Lecanicillium saksenae]
MSIMHHRHRPPGITKFGVENTMTDTKTTGLMEPMPNSEEGPVGPASPQSYSRKPLSCSTCRIKKIRCDKRMPCCHCVKANIRCTFPSQRKPRERKPHLKNRLPEEQQETVSGGDALADRLKSLEAQVSSLQTQLQDVKGETAPPAKYELVKRTTVRPHAKPAGTISHIKSSFWTSINFELQRQLSSRRSKGIQLQLQYNSLAGPSFPVQSQPDVSILLFKSFQGLSHPLHHPPETHIMLFWHVFKENVEPMAKVLHSPTMANLVERALWHRHTLSTAEHALLFAIYYVATAAMGEEMIIREFSVSKASLLSRMRVLVEQALVAAKFATTVDVTVLQAAMLFILVLRKTGEARSAGSLVGVVVHLAQCLRLHKDSAGVYDLTPFQREMRRRLFWCVVVLDQRSAEDLGTDPMIPEEMWDTPLPLNINDDDISENSPTLPESRDGMTDMTFSMIRLHTMQTSVRVRRLASDDPSQTIESLDQLCEEIWQETHDMLYAKYVDPNPSHELVWAAKTMASCIISKMKLTDQCSFYSPEDAHAMTESTQGRSMAHLTSAIGVMEQNHSANVDDRWAKWKWVFVAYSRWHGSAILFKEMLRRAWTPVSEQGWVTLHKIMGDSNLGELECLRDQPVMPLPFGFIYELTKNYRESEYARLRSQPDEARRLRDEAVREGQRDHQGSPSGDRASGVSASSLERWERAAGLLCVDDISAQVPRGVITSLDDEENTASNANSLVIAHSLPQTYGPAQLPAASLEYQVAGTEQWLVGDAMPVEYMENILDEIF